MNEITRSMNSSLNLAQRWKGVYHCLPNRLLCKSPVYFTAPSKHGWQDSHLVGRYVTLVTLVQLPKTPVQGEHFSTRNCRKLLERDQSSIARMRYQSYSRTTLFKQNTLSIIDKYFTNTNVFMGSSRLGTCDAVYSQVTYYQFGHNLTITIICYMYSIPEIEVLCLPGNDQQHQKQIQLLHMVYYPRVTFSCLTVWVWTF